MLRNRPKLAGTLVGCLITSVTTAVFFLATGLSPLELIAYDLRARSFSTVPASDKIVHVDIDDRSLESIGRWPWPRSVQAELILTLKELGAELICVDLLLSERQQEYFDHPSVGEDADIDPVPDVLSELTDHNKVLGDQELAYAMARSGRVILAVQLDVVTDAARANPLHVLESRWPADRDADPATFLRTLGVEPTPEWLIQIRNAQLAHRIADELRADFSLDETQLSRRLNVSRDDVIAVIAGAKREVARQRVDALFKNGKTPELDAVRRAILGERHVRASHDRSDVHRAYRTALGMYEVRRRLHPMNLSLAPRVHDARGVVPPYYAFARAALDLAAVKFHEDESRWVPGVRRVPIAVEVEGKLMPHMGLAAAAHALALDLDRISLPSSRRLRVPFKSGGHLDVPLDGRGNMLIPWTRTGPRWRLGEDFAHIPAAKIYSIADARRGIRNNEAVALQSMSRVIAVSRGARFETIDGRENEIRGDSRYNEMANQRADLALDIHRSRLYQMASDQELADMQAAFDRLDGEIRRMEQEALADVERVGRELDAAATTTAADEDPAQAERRERYRYARRIVDGELRNIRSANEKLQTAINESLAQLRPHISGKYVFLGYAATAEGDIVPTPIDPRTNGVMCLANVLNAFLQGRFIALAPSTALEVALCMLIGAAISFVTATRAPRVALPVAAVLLGAWALFNAAVLFGSRDLFFQVVPAVVTGFLAWVGVTLFRQLTAERDRRMFIKQLSQYTAPAIAARIAESPDAAHAFKSVVTRDITCYFSDLKGFTSISEREDPEVVQHVLNVYLERMSRVIWAGRGLINKFMGDGIMAFFNSSVDPLPDHAVVACETAVQTLDELRRLVRERQDEGAAGNVFRQMEMRIGLACGLCKNGDMGSELKADYTVIGDVVNLAARLEPANKVFGTSILVSGPLHDRVKDRFEFRYLAELQVKGRQQTVPVYEIMGRAGQISDDERAYARRFEAGVELYKARKWDECIVHFTRMLARRPNDPGASRYIDACQELKTFPPGDQWNGALELKEK